MIYLRTSASIQVPFSVNVLSANKQDLWNAAIQALHVEC